MIMSGVTFFSLLRNYSGNKMNDQDINIFKINIEKHMLYKVFLMNKMIEQILFLFFPKKQIINKITTMLY